ncbi:MULTISPECIES: DUF1499 domain-containing protein [unclassified Synechocystis]|uniref:DUF1499 domain-containing protein n=1 Tax=unclassified Synechocystis TaxID=2640012 RepID=UPI00041EC262|nr:MULTISPECIES: DUF1499 domain-containing protein [unclassified Synechocystis]AIE74214.1 hypothetical protein D082_16860 [Synechocystis sp. PCC 6714]MCT0252845.1 DUF1499 domain-containing protein [Synechocystis sp. CS-94]
MAALLAVLLSGMVWFAALPGFGQIFSGTVPENLGITNGQLAPCPDTPNCVNSQIKDDPIHGIEPLHYQGDWADARNLVTEILGVVPGTTIVEAQDNYIRAEARSRLMGFVDDLELYFPGDRPVIEVRSASRLGESDLGVNRRRLEQIRLALADLEQRN